MAVQINVVGQYNGRELERAMKDLDRLRKQAANAADGVAGSMQRVGDRLTGVGQGMANVGDRMTTRVTLPVVAAGGAFLKMSTDLNKGMANVASLGIAEERVVELKGAVQDMSIEVGKSTDDLADGLYQTISAFGDTADTTKILEINAKAAAAGLATTTDAIALTSSVTKGYGDTSAAAVQQASDLAFAAVEMGQTTFPELAASVGKVIPLTSALGVSQEELFGTMATFTGVTGGAAEVSTQLRGVMQGLMQPTGDMATLMKDLGVESGEAMIEQFGLQESLNLIAAEAEKTGKPLGKYLSSIEAQTLALAATGGQADVYSEKMEAMGDVTGKSEGAFAKQTEGINAAGFQMQQAKQEAIVLGQRLGDTLAPMLLDVFAAAKPLVAKVEEAVSWFTDLDEAQQRQIVKWVAIVAAMGPVLSITGRLVSGIGRTVTGLSKLITTTGKVARGMATAGRAVAQASATAVKALARWIAAGAKWVAQQLVHAAKATASMAATAGRFVAHYARMAGAAMANAARMAASWIIAMGPVGWVIAAVVALVALIIANWDKVKKWTKAAWEWVSAKVAAVWKAITSTISAAVTKVVGFVTTLRDRVVGAVRALWDRVVQFFRNLKADAIRLVGELVNGYLTWVLRLRDRAIAIVQTIRDRVVGFFTGLRDSAVGKVRDLYDGIKGKLEDMVRFVREMPGKIRSAASGMWDGILSAFRGAINTIIRGWNRLEFRVPGFKVGPVSYGGFALGLPDIPQLAKGAIVKATAGGTLANIGEGRRDEAVIPLPPGWDRPGASPIGSGRSVTVNVGREAVVIHAGAGTDVRELRRIADEAVDRLASKIVREVHAGAGAA